jgi:hypothetical protein
MKRRHLLAGMPVIVTGIVSALPGNAPHRRCEWGLRYRTRPSSS